MTLLLAAGFWKAEDHPARMSFRYSATEASHDFLDLDFVLGFP